MHRLVTQEEMFELEAIQEWSRANLRQRNPFLKAAGCLRRKPLVEIAGKWQSSMESRHGIEKMTRKKPPLTVFPVPPLLIQVSSFLQKALQCQLIPLLDYIFHPLLDLHYLSH